MGSSRGSKRLISAYLQAETRKAEAEACKLEADKEARKAEAEREREAEARKAEAETRKACLLYTSPSPRDRQKSRMPSSA